MHSRGQAASPTFLPIVENPLPSDGGPAGDFWLTLCMAGGGWLSSACVCTTAAPFAKMVQSSVLQ